MRRGMILLALVTLLVSVVGVSTTSATAAGETEVLEVLGPWSGDDPEGAAFLAELGSVDGVEIVYEPAGGGLLIDRVTGDDPPDLIVVPQPALLTELSDYLIDLTAFVPEARLRMDYGDYLIDLTTVDGAVLGSPIKMDVKTLVWYQPSVFAAYGYNVPTTFTELIALSDSMVADGMTPWCNYIESGFATGWLATDWVEDLILSTEGPSVYDQWVAHDILFQDPRVESAFSLYEFMINTAGFVHDRPNMASVPFWENALPLGLGECLMHRQASFFAAAITGFGFDLDDFATFRFPSVDAAYDDAMVGAGVYVAAVDDTKAVDEAIKYMLSHKWGSAVLAPTADSTGWLVPNLRFKDARYQDDLVLSWLQAGHDALAAGQFRFDASDLMPPEVGAGTFWEGMTNIVIGAMTVPEVLATIDASWP